MRKWMRERLTRRKKGTEKAGAEPTPAPLQPAFYDNEVVSQPTREAEEHAEPEASEPHIIEPGNAADAQPAPARSGDGDALRRRRRRGRGGRGRSARASQPGRMAEGAVPAAVPVTSVAAGEVPTAPPRPPKGTVVLAIGLPGSGKSSWFKRNKITPLSSDLLRALLFDDPTEQRFQDLIFSNLRSMLKARLIARRPMNYVDATNLTPQERQGWIKLAKDYGYEVQAVLFDVPLEVCMERNRRRDRVVPEEAMRRMAGKLKPPAFEEGFSKITVVRVKQKE
ncbi:MAG TPA: AAA family ATPase [Terriglobales bacterium]|jgi:predicted kinase|nr:AAA family ATPase [Terriglobales bacterium]